MEITSTENSNSISDLEILEIMDTVEEIIDSEPDRPFTFRVTTAAETPTPGVTRKILYIGKSALETLKVLSREVAVSSDGSNNSLEPATPQVTS